MQPVLLSGEVTRFRGDGRRLGYPTANIRAETDLTEGVYFGFANLVTFSQKPSLIFVGVPKTMGESEKRVEVHILDIPDVDYYKNVMTVLIEYFHRPNKRFKTIQELVRTMHVDESTAREWFNLHPSPSIEMQSGG
ncbi:MAG: riboflavin kinase [Candidatus Saccharimonadales bacterium]